jgi:transposase
MLQIEFTEEEKQALNFERYYYPHPHVQRKMETVWLKSQGLPHQEICRLADISPHTLCDYLRDYKSGGIEKLKEVNFYQPTSELEEQRETLADYFRHHPPATIKEAAAKIKELTGIERKESQVRAFLKAMGMKCRKVGMLPAKADPDEQAAFKTDQLEPRLEEAKAGKRAAFFVDAAHFVLAPFLGFLWCFERVFIKAPAGRQRFNVLGALNAITHDLITVTNDTYINATSVCQLLVKLAELNLGVPITLILDNAKYQKCSLVLETAKKLDIELLFLPTYSPNLNLIERLWKFVKKQCLYSIYYPDFASFKAAILECLGQTNTQHKQALESLLALNFQTFKKVQIVTA